MVRKETIKKYNNYNNFLKDSGIPAIFKVVTMEDLEFIEELTNEQLEEIYLQYVISQSYSCSIYDIHFTDFLENEILFRKEYFTNEKMEKIMAEI